jgi:4-amino-4-deoxy-L-arabinose transferase-like glycosyltransferase
MEIPPRALTVVVAAACVLLLLQALPFFQYRWVEDDSWYTIPAYTFMRTGELRNPTFADTDAEYHADKRPPLMPLTTALFLKVFGITPAAARFPQLLAALAAVLLAYLIGKELGYAAAGAIAAVLTATDTFLFISARTVRPEAWVTFWGAVGVLLLLKSQRLGSGTLALGAGLAAGVSTVYHVTGLAWVAALFLLILYDNGWAALRNRRTYLYAAGVAAALVPFGLWLLSTPEATSSMYGRGQHVSWAVKLSMEWLRIRDFIGVPSQRLRLPVPLPLRLHVAVVIAAALVLLFRTKRVLFTRLVLLIGPHLLLWLYLVNKTARYFSILAPLLYLAVGLAVVVVCHTSRLRLAALAICAVVGVSQIIGNSLVLVQASKANYPVLQERLRNVIPLGASAYGAITFAVALNDRDYRSYDRTPFDYALAKVKPQYVITGDRVMLHGEGHGEDDNKAVRSAVMPYVERHGQLVASLDDPFYGPLRVYRLSY